MILLLPMLAVSQEYSTIVEMQGKSVDQLYSKTREWFAETFNSANNVLQMDDPIAGKLIGKGAATIVEPFNMVGIAKISSSITFNVDFTVKVSLKEAKYKCDITDIFITPVIQNSTYQSTKQSYSEMLLQKDYFKNGSDPVWLVENGAPGGQSIGKQRAKTVAEVNKAYYNMFVDLDKKMNGLMESLQTKMKKSDDNW